MKINELPTPCYVIDEKKLRKNLEILKKVKDDTGCRILLAQKAFSNFFEYPLTSFGQYLDGTTSGCLDMKRKPRIRSGLQRVGDRELTDICEHLVFNSFSQLEKYADFCKEKASASVFA